MKAAKRLNPPAEDLISPLVPSSPAPSTCYLLWNYAFNEGLLYLWGHFAILGFVLFVISLRSSLTGRIFLVFPVSPRIHSRMTTRISGEKLLQAEELQCHHDLCLVS